MKTLVLPFLPSFCQEQRFDVWGCSRHTKSTERKINTWRMVEKKDQKSLGLCWPHRNIETISETSCIKNKNKKKNPLFVKSTVSQLFCCLRPNVFLTETKTEARIILFKTSVRSHPSFTSKHPKDSYLTQGRQSSRGPTKPSAACPCGLPDLTSCHPPLTWNTPWSWLNTPSTLLPQAPPPVFL